MYGAAPQLCVRCVVVQYVGFHTFNQRYAVRYEFFETMLSRETTNSTNVHSLGK